MAIHTGLDPGIQPFFCPVAVGHDLANSGHEGIVGPAHLPHQVMRKLPLVLHVAELTRGRLHVSLLDRILQLHIEIPLVAIARIPEAVA